MQVHSALLRLFCAEALAELSLSLKRTITLEMYTQGCSEDPEQ